MIGGPHLILADEPTGNLDSVHGQEVMDSLVELNDNGTTIIMVTHDDSLAKRARRNVRILDGRIQSIDLVPDASHEPVKLAGESSAASI